MKSATLTCITAVTLCAALAVPIPLVAQDNQNHKHHHYQFVDLGTLGGPTSYFSNGADGILNNQGTAVGWADTSTPDPFPGSCFNSDCFVSHAFQSRNGVRIDLGTLPGGASSQAFWISANGLIAGNAQNGQIDPLIPGLPEARAVLWQNGKITDLGTLGGGTESLAAGVNTRGQVVGFAGTSVPDPFGLAGIQFRAFFWQSGTMQDLGTLGGNDAMALFINEAGEVAGSSYTNATPNPTTGFPTQDPFFWEHGTMLDLGTLGGTVGFPQGFNNRGEVVGQSNLAGDLTFHPFLWTKSGGIQDLGTLGGSTGLTNWINDAGDISGKADLPGPLPQNHDAVLWRHGAMIDLGTLPGDSCSNAYFVNSGGQVVGTSESRDLCLIPTGEHAFLWENGGPMVDLNSLIPPGSSLQLTFAFAINGHGEIVGTGVPSGCTPDNIGFCGHAFVLIPCDENHPAVEGCDYSLVDEPAATISVRSRPAEQNQTSANPATTGAANPMMMRGGMLPGSFQRVQSQFSNTPAAVSSPATISGPTASLSPTSLTYTAELVGSTSSPKPVTLINNGNKTLTITGLATTGDFSQTHTCGSSLSAGASCTINLSFKPTQIGTRTGKLSVTDNSSGSPQTVSLNGTGTVVKLAPAGLIFTTQLLNTTSPTESVVMMNAANISFGITRITTSGDFSQTDNCGSTLAAGTSCTISVTFRPTQIGTRTGALSISDTGGGSPQVLPLSGTGTVVKLAPASLTFGRQVIDTTSAPQDVTMTNTGATPLNITGISLTGADASDFMQTNSCGTSVGAGASCVISVEFKPTQTGTRTATCSISDNGGASPQPIPLSGTGGRTCTPEGMECPPQFPPCCPGLTCVPASTRAFCLAI